MCRYWSNSFLTSLSLSNIYFFNISITLINLYSLHQCLFLHLFHHSVCKTCTISNCSPYMYTDQMLFIYTKIGKCWVWSGCKIHSLKFSSKNCCEMWILQSSVGRQISWFSFAISWYPVNRNFFQLLQWYNGIIIIMMMIYKAPNKRACVCFWIWHATFPFGNEMFKEYVQNLI